MYTSVLLVIIGSTQRVQTDHSREVNVVFDDHDVTRLEAVRQWAGSICHNQSLHPQQLEDSNWKCCLTHTGGQERYVKVFKVVKFFSFQITLLLTVKAEPF